MDSEKIGTTMLVLKNIMDSLKPILYSNILYISKDLNEPNSWNPFYKPRIYQLAVDLNLIESKEDIEQRNLEKAARMELEADPLEDCINGCNSECRQRCQKKMLEDNKDKDKETDKDFDKEGKDYRTDNKSNSNDKNKDKNKDKNTDSSRFVQNKKSKNIQNQRSKSKNTVNTKSEKTTYRLKSLFKRVHKSYKEK